MEFDIAIVGGGIVGATTALALAQKTSLTIALLEALPQQSRVNRVSAISPASKKIFADLGVWEAIVAKGVSPYYQMLVWDEKSAGKIQFNCDEIGESELGFIIEDKVILDCLYEAITQQSQIHFLSPVQLVELKTQQLMTQDGKSITAKWIVAADGARSWVREQVGFEIEKKEYEQTALVATVKTGEPHEAIARQRFLSTGPLAFLPLQEAHTSSIVWSLSPKLAKELLALSESEFCQRLEIAFENKLGKVSLCSERLSFPLQRSHAKNYLKDQFILLGDAAHTIHPLAGQGLNLGLQDAACLVSTLQQALLRERDITRLATLRPFERARKSENALMMQSIDFLHWLFTHEKKPMQRVRGLALNLIDRASFIKKIFIQYAS